MFLINAKIFCDAGQVPIIRYFEAWSVQIFWAILASFSHLGLIRDPLMVSKFHNGIHDSKGHENKINIIVKGRETFYRSQQY